MNHALKIRGKSHTLQVKHLDKNNLEIQIGDAVYPVELIFTKNGKYIFKTQDKTITTYVAENKSGAVDVAFNGLVFNIEDEKLAASLAGSASAGHVVEDADYIASPIPGKVVKIEVKEGDAVKKGQPCIIVEAMKMENELGAPKDGIIKAIHVQEGDSVEAEKPLIELTD